ncbi:hypothetical protein BU16DRAFT_537983 [Lophium mytilinum]|uniref:Uncharacterized protein n=1 Tax=Lophium mytilinum TaxID=390894 RepID=A0A6A6QWM2_9PEZI|nr:hypothetical protein BU16DRAFT_537983 [Lophium mytilinum]
MAYEWNTKHDLPPTREYLEGLLFNDDDRPFSGHDEESFQFHDGLGAPNLEDSYGALPIASGTGGVAYTTTFPTYNIFDNSAFRGHTERDLQHSTNEDTTFASYSDDNEEFDWSLASGDDVVARPTLPAQGANAHGKNDLYRNISINHHGLYFTSAKESCDIFRRQPLWRPAKEDLPNGNDARVPYVVRIRDAMMRLPTPKKIGGTGDQMNSQTTVQFGDIVQTGKKAVGQTNNNAHSEAKDGGAGQPGTTSTQRQANIVPKRASQSTKNQSGKESLKLPTRGPTGGMARWGPNNRYYEPQAIEIAAHILVGKVIELHTNGWTRPNLDPKQLEMEKIYEPELSFETRIVALEEIFQVTKNHKAACKALLDMDDLYIDQVVAGPSKFLERTLGYRKNNEKRKETYAKGREKNTEGAQSASQQQVGTKLPTRVKREADTMFEGDEGASKDNTSGEVVHPRKPKKPRSSGGEVAKLAKAEGDLQSQGNTGSRSSSNAVAASPTGGMKIRPSRLTAPGTPASYATTPGDKPAGVPGASTSNRRSGRKPKPRISSSTK